MKKWEKPVLSNLEISKTEKQQMACKNHPCVKALDIGGSNGSGKKWECPVCHTTDPSMFNHMKHDSCS